MQALSVFAGASACFLTVPALIIYNIPHISRLKFWLGLVSLLPSGVISFYHWTSNSSPWLFLLGGASVATIAPSLEYMFLLLLAAGWKETFAWHKHNENWLHKTGKCLHMFLPLAVMQFL